MQSDDEPTPTEEPKGKRGQKRGDSEGEDDGEKGEIESLPAPPAPKKKKDGKGPTVEMGAQPDVLLATMLDVDPALFTQEWFDALSDEQRAALLRIFIGVNGDHVTVFLTGSQEAKFMAWKGLLEEARRHDREFEQVEQEETRVKEKKRARSAESSESSESEDLMQTAFIEEGATWGTVKVKFPEVLSLSDFAQMSENVPKRART